MNAFSNEPSRRTAVGPICLAVLLLAGGCSILPFHKTQTAPNIAAPGQAPLTVTQLQSEVLRFADDYASSVANAADRAAKSAGTREALVAALKWKLEQATAAYVSATGENPVWDALDIVVLAVVSGMVVDDAKAKEEFGAAVVPLIQTHRELEASAWTLASQILGPEQREQLQGLIVEWREQNPRERSVGAIHFREFALATEKNQKGGALSKLGTSSVFTLLHIDPFAGLDPATVAIEQSRELAARSVAYFERAPTLLRWQAELLALQLADQPDPQKLIADAGRVSRSMESVSKTAEGLPALVKEEREAAIAQLLAGVAAEREAVLRDLDSREATIRGLLGETRQTLEAGTAMSNSLDATVKSLDAFMHYVSPPPRPGAPPAPAGKPFDVLDYGKSATDVAGMARELQTLLVSIDRSGPALAKVGAETGENLKRVVDHAFWRGLVLILVLLVGSVLAVLAYRALARRLFARHGTSAA